MEISISILGLNCLKCGELFTINIQRKGRENGEYS